MFSPKPSEKAIKPRGGPAVGVNRDSVVKVNTLTWFSMEVTVNAVKLELQMGGSSGKSWAPPDPEGALYRWEGPRLYKDLVLSRPPCRCHFTGGEAHRLPHLTVTSLWERLQEEGGAAEQTIKTKLDPLKVLHTVAGFGEEVHNAEFF